MLHGTEGASSTEPRKKEREREKRRGAGRKENYKR
jgi:hypothetical protein